MATKRFADNAVLAALADTVHLVGFSPDGGAATPSGTVAPGDDIAIPLPDVLAAARAVGVNDTVTSNTITPAAPQGLLRALGLDADLTIANPSADYDDGDGFILYLEDDGTERELTFGSEYEGSEFADLPTETIPGKRMRLGFEQDDDAGKMRLQYLDVEA